MKLIPKYQKGNLVARQDNTRVIKSPILTTPIIGGTIYGNNK